MSRGDVGPGRRRFGTPISARALGLIGRIGLPAAVACQGLLTLIGSGIDQPLLVRYGRQLPSASANAAICLILLAVAQLLRGWPSLRRSVRNGSGRNGPGRNGPVPSGPSRSGADRNGLVPADTAAPARWPRLAGGAAALIAGLLAVVALWQWQTGVRCGPVDLFQFTSCRQGLSGRMSPQEAATLAVLALAELSAGRRGGAWWPVRAAGMLAAVSGTAALVGIGLGVPREWSARTVVGMAIPVATGLVGLGLAFLAAQPRRIPADLLTSTGAGGWMARVLLPAIVAFPVASTVVLDTARTALHFTDSEAWSVLVVSGIIVPAIGLLIITEALDRTERQRAAAVVSAAHAHDQLQLLADVGEVITEATRESALREQVVRLLSERLDGWCGIFQPAAARMLTLAAAAGSDGEDMSLGEEAPSDEQHPVRLAWYYARPAHGTVNGAATLAIPLLARGQTIGVLAVTRPAYGVWPRHDDERVLVDIGRRIGKGLDNLYQLQARTAVAERLQADLLPRRLPTVDRCELAVRYLTADADADVGGDFYDAFPLGSDTYALVIGDVSGRGATAASLTGFARTTLRALSAELGPAAALQRLNALLLDRDDPDRFLTAAYLRIGPRTGSGIAATVCLAGHLQPIVVDADGVIRWLGTPGTLLGLFEDPSLTEQIAWLSPGDTLVLYTDGVTEARGPAGLFGPDRLAAALSHLAGRSAEAVVTELERTILAYRTSAPDDTALLALRLVPAHEPVQTVLVDLHLPATTATAALARRAVADALARTWPDPVPGGSTLADGLTLTVSELVTNAVRQVLRQPTLTLRSDPIGLRMLYDSRTLRIEVRNPGDGFTLPTESGLPAVTAERGRGLHLVRALNSRMGTTAGNGATCVWSEVDLPVAPTMRAPRVPADVGPASGR